MGESEHDFHVRRAREELDRAYRAEIHSVMAAHFRLSALHMARAESTADERQSAPHPRIPALA